MHWSFIKMRCFLEASNCSFSMPLHCSAAVLTRCLLKSQSLSCHQLANCANIFPVSAAQSAAAVSLPAMPVIRPAAFRDLTGLPLWWLPQRWDQLRLWKLHSKHTKVKKEQSGALGRVPASRPPPAVLSNRGGEYKVWSREHRAGRGAHSVQSMMGNGRQDQPGSWPREPTQPPWRERRVVMRQTRVSHGWSRAADGHFSLHLSLLCRRLWEQETSDGL